MKRHVVVAASLFAATVCLAGCRGALGSAPGVQLPQRPEVVYTTNAFPVGTTYTLGSLGVPDDVARPVVVTEIEVLETHGVEVVDMAAYDAAAVSPGIGLVEGWPPPIDSGQLQPSPSEHRWDVDHVGVIVGLRTTEPLSGLRGVRVTWHDADGATGTRVFDHAVVTCAAEQDCGSHDPELDDDEALLVRLGLFRP